ncbi:lytic transglycosylase domain-containing protein [Flavobacteriaceae bacterium F08102]|nr:lytic transglycosylase domain-containing protein [Flavobacteriaceae bacterium F08102]
MNNPLRIVVIITIIGLGGILINAAQQENYSPNDQGHEPSVVTDSNYQISAVKIPDDLNLAGEKVPLEKSYIREQIDRELLVNTYWQSNALLWLKRINKYFPIIEPILKENGVPDDFKYLAVIESNLMNVTSPAGAKGFWQIMPAAGREFGLEINSNVDERYHLEKATKAACDYLKAAKEKFGSWTLAAAAYHAGISGIASKLAEQKVDNYYDLLSGENTERYVPRILAAKEILSNPEKYGFHFEEDDLYTLEKTKLIKVDTAISNIAEFALSQGTYYRELKNLNPWLRQNKLNNKSRKVYYIKIPI